MLNAWDDQHQFIKVGGARTSLSDMAMMIAPDGVSMPATLDMLQCPHTHQRVVLATLFGIDHPTAMLMKELNVEIMEREMELYEYNPRAQGLKDCLLASITRWV